MEDTSPTERTARVAKRDKVADEQLNESDLGPEQLGLIITHYGTQVVVEATEGEQAGQHQRCHFRSNLGSLVTGDRVVWRTGNPMGVVVAVMPRDSALQRPDPHGDMKTVAANIDRIMIVVAPYPEPHANLIDRYLEQNLNPSDLNAELESTIEGYGAIVTDIGVAFSKAFTLDNGNHLLVGFKPKKVEVESIIYTSNVADFDEDDFDADDYTRKEDSMNYDLGLTYIAGNLRYGLVANNLQNKDYKTIDPEEVISIERQFVGAVGVALVFGQPAVRGGYVH